MKILHTADWHIGKLLEGKSRLQEQEMVLEQFVRIADETQADVVCIAGDIFDNGSSVSRGRGPSIPDFKRFNCTGRATGSHDCRQS